MTRNSRPARSTRPAPLAGIEHSGPVSGVGSAAVGSAHTPKQVSCAGGMRPPRPSADRRQGRPRCAPSLPKTTAPSVLGWKSRLYPFPLYDPERRKPAMKFGLSKRVGRGPPRPSRKARGGSPPKLVRRECGNAPGMVRIEGEPYARMLRRPRPATRAVATAPAAKMRAPTSAPGPALSLAAATRSAAAVRASSAAITHISDGRMRGLGAWPIAARDACSACW